MATESKLLSVIEKAMINDAAAMAPFARLAAHIVRKKVKEPVKDLVLTAPSTPPSDFNFFSNGARKSRKKRNYKRKTSQRKSSVLSQMKLHGLWKNRLKKRQSCWIISSGSNVKDTAPKLEESHATDRHFNNVVNYKTYCLLDGSQVYNEKMAAVRVNTLRVRRRWKWRTSWMIRVPWKCYVL